MANYAELITTKLGGLKSRFGYISKKKAVTVAEDIAKKAEQEIGSLEREMAEYKGKTAEEIAQLTSEKDTLTLNLNAANKKLEKTKVTRRLENGNKLECTTKPVTGTSQEVEKTIVDGEERVVRVKTRTADGHERTSYKDLKTGETVSIEDTIRPLDYPTQETAISEELKRLKGLEMQKGAPLTASEAQPIVKATTYAKNGDAIQRMSDGTTRRIHEYSRGHYDVEIKNGDTVVGRVSKNINGKESRELINGDTRTFIEKSDEINRSRTYVKTSKNIEVLTKEEVLLHDGTKGVVERIPDEFGQYGTRDVMKVTYPEGSPYETAEIKRNIRMQYSSDSYGEPYEAIVTTKNGASITLSDFSNGVPTKSSRPGDARTLWETANIRELSGVYMWTPPKINNFMRY